MPGSYWKQQYLPHNQTCVDPNHKRIDDRWEGMCPGEAMVLQTCQGARLNSGSLGDPAMQLAPGVAMVQAWCR